MEVEINAVVPVKELCPAAMHISESTVYSIKTTDDGFTFFETLSICENIHSAANMLIIGGQKEIPILNLESHWGCVRKPWVIDSHLVKWVIAGKEWSVAAHKGNINHRFLSGGYWTY